MKAPAPLIFIAIVLMAAAGWAARDQLGSTRPSRVTNSDTPQILAFSVTPKTLENNRINFVRLYFKFRDDLADLNGGLLTINFKYKSASGETLFLIPPQAAGPSGQTGSRPGVIPIPDGNRPSFVTYPLTESVFKKKRGEFVLWFGLLGENFKDIAVSIWLRDSDGTNGLDSPEVTLVRSTSPSDPKQGRQIGQLAYDFTLLDKANNRKRLSTFRGKVVLIDFSTMWCGPCRGEAAELQELYLKYKSRGFIILNILTQNYATNPIRTSDCKTWAQAYELTFPVLADLFWGVFDAYYAFPNTQRIPNNVLIDKSGKIRWKKLGFTPAIQAEMEAKILKLLAE